MIGCGDIAIRLANDLIQDLSITKNSENKKTLELYGLRRHIDQLPKTIQGIACDLNTIDDLKECLGDGERSFDYVVITLVPNERSDEGYRQAYVANIEKIITGLEALDSPPKWVFLVSSTSVYGQQAEQWVDEDSHTEPTHYSGQRVLQGEQRLVQSTIPSTVIRFSGIYGPGRLRIIQQVENGDWEPEGSDEKLNNGYSNRIHADDCAGVLAHFMRKAIKNEPLDNCYLASDCEPVRLNEVKQWIANRLGITNTKKVDEMPLTNNTNTKMRRNSKKCSNKKLLASGYHFKYPTFREGYGQVIEHLKSTK